MCFAHIWRFLTFTKGLERFLIIGWVVGEKLFRENGLFHKETKQKQILRWYFFERNFFFYYYFFFFWQAHRFRRNFFEKISGISRLHTLPQEIPNRTKLKLWKFCKIVLDPLEIPRPKIKTCGNSTWFFLDHLWRFHFVFN